MRLPRQLLWKRKSKSLHTAGTQAKLKFLPGSPCRDVFEEYYSSDDDDGSSDGDGHSYGKADYWNDRYRSDQGGVVEVLGSFSPVR